MGRDRGTCALRRGLALEFVLEADPILPSLLDRQAEDLQKLVGPVAPGALVTPEPRDHLFRGIGIGEPGDEPRAIEVGIRANLKIHKRAPRCQAQWVIEMSSSRTIARNTISSNRLARGPDRHPSRSRENCAALQVPARGRVARNSEVAVEQRFRILPLRRDLAEEDSPPAPILLGRDVALHHVDQLVIHQRVHAFAGGKVSNAWDSGATSKTSKPRGAA